MKTKNTPRAIRNRNLGNLRTGCSWYGLEGWDSQDFIRFNTFENGIRACVRLMLTYRKRGLNTIKKILQSYAPSHENDTNAYVCSVSTKTGIGCDEPLFRDDYKRVLLAIFEVECGMSADDIQSMCIRNGANPLFDLREVISSYIETFFPEIEI